MTSLSRLSRWLGLLLFVSACSSEVDVRLNLPAELRERGFSAALLILEGQGPEGSRIESVTAIDLMEPVLERLTIDDPKQQRVYLLGYQTWEPLQELGVEVGLVRSVPLTTEDATPIPNGALEFEMVSTDNARWTPTALDTSALPFRLPPRPGVCSRFGSEFRSFDELGVISFFSILSLDDETFVAGGGDEIETGFLGIASFSRPFEHIQLPAGTHDVVSLARVDERTFIGTSRDRKAFVFDLDSMSVTATLATSGVRLVTGAGDAIVMFQSGPLVWIDRNLQTTPIGVDPPAVRRVLSLSRNEVYVGDSQELHRWDGTQWRSIYCCFGNVREVFAGFGGLGVLASGVVHMRALEDEDGAWSQIASTTRLDLYHAGFIAPMTPFVAGTAGFASSWVENRWCDVTTHVPRAVQDIALAPSGDHLFTVTYGEILAPPTGARISFGGQ